MSLLIRHRQIRKGTLTNVDLFLAGMRYAWILDHMSEARKHARFGNPAVVKHHVQAARSHHHTMLRMLRLP